MCKESGMRRRPWWAIQTTCCAIALIAGCAPSVDPRMEAAFYDLVHADSYTDPKNPAVMALAEIGNPAVPRLIELLSDPERMVRRKSAFALAEMEPPPTSAVPALIALLEDREFENWVARHPAAVALGRMDAAGVVAIPALVATLTDESLGVQHFAAQALIELGEPAVPAIANALRDEENEHKMVWELHRNGGPLLPELVPHLAPLLGILYVDELLRRVGTPAAMAAIERYENEQRALDGD
ncbi:HEAT repeat domain-containing protein [Candidatus Poribacteria bacterium]|nr:HEAT repeat domain-containing protein [Candidatus Poribacteria bacterium]MBT5533658.1 HEAT repeat domain-containing protein [Candidatus Poribacteria bacterium]MBT7101582.1 HEAT repeat domain-containing protein [Candidatus Poribacteria bacterium]MBT7809654.1 HEAT repeat domain-containing protein [Candidatus Poribacteria bacterium]